MFLLFGTGCSGRSELQGRKLAFQSQKTLPVGAVSGPKLRMRERKNKSHQDSPTGEFHPNVDRARKSGGAGRGRFCRGCSPLREIDLGSGQKRCIIVTSTFFRGGVCPSRASPSLAGRTGARGPSCSLPNPGRPRMRGKVGRGEERGGSDFSFLV